jgi:hypothetical protein
MFSEHGYDFLSQIHTVYSESINYKFMPKINHTIKTQSLRQKQGNNKYLLIKWFSSNITLSVQIEAQN